MVQRGVERREVVEVFLDLRAVGDIEADRTEDRLDTLDRERQRMQAPGTATATGQRDVDRFLGEPRLQFGLGEFMLAGVHQRLDRLLGLVQLATGRRARLTRELSQRLHALGEIALAPEKARLRVRKAGRIGCLGDQPTSLLDEGVEVLIHGRGTPEGDGRDEHKARRGPGAPSAGQPARRMHEASGDARLRPRRAKPWPARRSPRRQACR
jgi:hypothetical protein